MKTYFVNLFHYNNWANTEVLDCLLKISEPPVKSISIMSHIINAQKLWLCRMKKVECDVDPWTFYQKTDLVNELKISSHELSDFLNEITGSELDKEIAYTNSKGDTFTSRMIDMLTQLAIHSAYHRGQIVIEVKPMVDMLPLTDYIHYVRSVRK